MTTDRSGVSVGLGNGVVDVDEDSGLVASVDTWNSNGWARSSATSVDDFNLAARNVELRATERRSNVKSDGFHADEVSATLLDTHIYVQEKGLLSGGEL